MILQGWHAYQRRRRMEAFPALFAQDLEILASALRAGSSFMQAVQIAAQEGEGPLAEEWSIFLNEIHHGASLTQALDHLQTRLPIPAVRSLASVVTIIQETGGNLAGVLLTLADVLRQEIAFQSKLRAMTAQGRLSGYVVSAMPFFIMVVLEFLAPDLMRPLFVTPVGWMMILAVIVLVTIGALLIKKIVTIEV